MSIFSVTARMIQAWIPCPPPPPEGRSLVYCALVAGPEDRKQELGFILGSNTIDTIREVLPLSVPQFPGSPAHSGARSSGFGVGQVLVHMQVQLLTYSMSPWVLMSSEPQFSCLKSGDDHACLRGSL